MTLAPFLSLKRLNSGTRKAGSGPAAGAWARNGASGVWGAIGGPMAVRPAGAMVGATDAEAATAALAGTTVAGGVAAQPAPLASRTAATPITRVPRKATAA